ncbi:MAG: hypothetical protein P8K68_07675 [Algibacter sp.]|uniref:hypothetical protein n=1 Tax=Algibacter sp. TaxID=1872428 RepID=UPI00261FCF80|nr:hypothetical protein [Algibacter sp.]MDG1729463.1 hypothetical protein [Algibacter sp.]MDG2178649.1 hypothetical protein [Algibacter sp.]
MTTLISNPKAKLLLGAALDILHFESREWLDTIEFLKDEIRFFENLLKQKESEESNKQEFTKLLKNLDKIHIDFLEDLEDDIIQHESTLSKIVKGEKGLSDAVYRDKHSQLAKRMNTFTENFKTFKKIIFDHAKDI